MSFLNTFHMFSFTAHISDELDVNFYGILCFRGGLIYVLTTFILL